MPQQTRRPYPLEASPPTPESLAALTQRNIELIAQLEATAAAKRSPADYIADAITHFCGSMAFVYVHVVWFGGWMLWHFLPGLPQAIRFDPYPFQFLTFVVSLEAIFLSTFILISQNHEKLLADRRNHLDLQVNLLSEQENSKMLAMLDSIQKHLGISESDPEVRVLEEATKPDKLLEQIQERVEREPK